MSAARLLLPLVVLVVAGVGAAAQTDGLLLEGAYTPAQATGGARTFDRACASCHDPGEFSGGRFRLTWVGRSTGDLFETISTLMPEADPGSLSPDEYAAVVAYLLSLNGYPPGDVPLPADRSVLQAVPIVAPPATDTR